MIGRIPITDVRPVVDCGDWPVKAVVGETITVRAVVFREGHDAVAANVVLVGPDGAEAPFTRMVEVNHGLAQWQAQVTVTAPGAWRFRVEGWGDPLGTWWHDAPIKIEADQDVDLVLEEGARLYERTLEGLPGGRADDVRKVVDTMRDTGRSAYDRLTPALDADLVALLSEHPVRELVTSTPAYDVWVDRERALYGSWYELFPRSEGAAYDEESETWRSGTLRTAMERLPAIRDMGFDVVYLPPVHPIGTTFRKGANNSLFTQPADPGSPWAIGSPDGGHDAIHPDLGTFDDFDAFVARTRELGMEVALDLALQASPDHPWVTEHPEWFSARADGSIAYAENPPKKYQDIYPINFDRDRDGIYAEVLRIVRVWLDHGVRIFRVDNPHTKPLEFWAWLIAEVKKTDPDVIWLAEAFTRPPMMHALARVGFSQSYTYFTWRTEAWEIEEYLRELSGDAADYMRPNFFVNTPDILTDYLQYGGPPAFKIRAVLAALLSPSWGVYSGYELFEHVAVRPGSEEYLDSEKYSYRPRDWAAAEREGRSLAPYITMLNTIRREHPALQQLRDLTFHYSAAPQIMAWSKRAGDDVVLVVVNLDPHSVRESTINLDLPAVGADWGQPVEVHDLVSGNTWLWSEHNYVRLDPFVEPAHIFTLRRR
ncbi:MAG TPA: alpha-1,4-glucan--maltose-1-phosphate maltosyltransferase [Mycobacteriales bacterium]|jgi:starch synthase (maltosyl-transferring)|nr:alpha-1,4-glucan--maltose-1-phosphate maltosyltransferase [Mycobacteriales bacterium]